MAALVCVGVVRWNRKSCNGPKAAIFCRLIERPACGLGCFRNRVTFEHSEPHYAGTYPPGSDRRLGDLLRGDVDRLRAVPRRRGERRCRRLPRQALRHDHRARRLPRSAGRQGAAGLDLCDPGGQRPLAALAGHFGGLARRHDRRRRHAVLAGRQPGEDAAADRVQAEHGGADRAGLRRARLARLPPVAGDRDPSPDVPGGGNHATLGGGLSHGMDAPHERGYGETMNPLTPATLVPDPRGRDGIRRQVMFWLGGFAVIVLVLWLLSDILLPFIMGLAIAYLLTPLTDRMERHGVNRLAAALLIITVVVMLFVLLVLLVAPVLGGQLASFIDNIPLYVSKLRALMTDPSRPWLQKLLGVGFNTDKGISDLVSQGVGYLTSFLKSLWSGGRALVSLFSLLVVTPVVAFYLIYDWHRMIDKVDSWIPVKQRDTVRGLAREIDAAIAGFVRGQTAVCMVLGSFYAVALTLSGLNFGLLLGLISGLITFIPYVGSMTGLVLSLAVAVAQFW